MRSKRPETYFTVTHPGVTCPIATPARLAASLSGPGERPARLPRRGQRVGLLGGSFNPAHPGHRFISTEALRRLRLDMVWWLVSPQNPLKTRAGMAPLAERLASARAQTRHPRIQAGELERVLGTVYTVDTLAALQARFPGVHFVWLMGADNLRQIDRWQGWQQIFHSLPVAVFDRPTYSKAASVSKAAQRFRPWRLPQTAAPCLAQRRPPAWIFLFQPRDSHSATAIRARQRKASSARDGA